MKNKTKESISRIQIKDKSTVDKVVTIAPFRKGVRKTEPHKHNQYLEIIYLSDGEGNHWIDDKRYPVKPPALFFVNTDQMHNWDLTSEPEGHVLIIKHSFLKHSEDEQLKQLVQRLRPFNCTYLHLNSKDELESLFDLLERQSISDDFYHKVAIEGLLKALISKILILVHSSINHFSESTHLYAHYLDLLNQQSKSHRKVSHYARQLGTSPQNLNAICRKAVNQTAGQLITMQILGEAKRLLLYTNNTVSQIAYQLGFTDPSYFVKYFKRHLNVTPEAFRKLSFSK